MDDGIAVVTTVIYGVPLFNYNGGQTTASTESRAHPKIIINISDGIRDCYGSQATASRECIITN
jgi:hypothetical protein